MKIIMNGEWLSNRKEAEVTDISQISTGKRQGKLLACRHLLNIELRLHPQGLHPFNFYGKNVRGL
jgi:hypothetical protein